jgi:hypothetical protein
MRNIKDLVQNIEEPIEAWYKGLTIEEFEGSNYPDSKLAHVSVKGKYEGREFQLAFIQKEEGEKFVNIYTPASSHYYRVKGSGLIFYTKKELKRIKEEEEEAKRSLESFTRRVRERTGGYRS